LPETAKIVWVQEEPANMGALNYVRPRLKSVVGGRHVTSIKRFESASPATGSAKAHALEQRALIKLAFA
jgi:2-oxoglutarate dehydrogenase E1 component